MTMVYRDGGSQLANATIDSNFRQCADRLTSVAASATITLDPEYNYYEVTGTTQVTGLSTANIDDGTIVYLEIKGSPGTQGPRFKNGTSFYLPDGKDINTYINDILVFMKDADDNWRLINYYNYYDAVNPNTKKNVLLNGDFNLWQRGTSFAAAAKNICDQWYMNTATQTAARDVVGTPPSFPYDLDGYCLKLSQSNAGLETRVDQYIEAAVAAQLIYKRLTLSFWAKCDVGSTALATSASIGVPTSATNDDWSSGVTAFASGTPTDVDGNSALTTSWVKYSVTFSSAIVPATATKGLVLLLKRDAGVADTYFKNVQLEIGTSPTDFELVDPADMLAKCQRFYEKSYDLDVDPGTVGNSEGSAKVSQSIAGLDYAWGIEVPFKVTKRTTPTVTWYDPASVTSPADTLYASTDGQVTVTSTTDASHSSTGQPVTFGTTLTVDQRIYAQWTAEAALRQ